MKITRRNHSARVIERLRLISGIWEITGDDKQLLSMTEGTFLYHRAEFYVAIEDLKSAIWRQFRDPALLIRLWWIGLGENRHRRLIGEIGLCAHRPGGNARDRRQYYRHPVRHSRVHLWDPAFKLYITGRSARIE